MDTEEATRVLCDAAEVRHGTALPSRTADAESINRASEALRDMLDRVTDAARKEGIALGAEAAHTLWRQWTSDMREAQATGTQFAGATPDGIAYAFLRPGRHSQRCERMRNRRKIQSIPDHKCYAPRTDYYDRKGEPTSGALCPACRTNPPPRGIHHGSRTHCPCGAVFATYGNTLYYWYPLAFYASRPDLVSDGGAPCVAPH